MSAYDARAFERLARLEPASFWFRSRNRLIVWALRRFFPAMRDYLEIGCGTGFVLGAVADAFPDAAIHGAEASSEAFRFARARAPKAELHELAAEDLAFGPDFDVVGAFDVLEHLDDDERALSACFRAIRGGGGFLATVPQHRFLWSAVDEFSGHRRRYAPRELEAKVEAAGFRVLMSTSFVSILLPLAYLSRSRYRSGFSEAQAEAELKAPPALDRALEAALSAERVLIAAGARLPFGASRLVAALKP